jgi:hypothetical protein
MSPRDGNQAIQGGTVRKKLAASVLAMGVLGGVFASAGSAYADSPRVDLYANGIDRCVADWHSTANEFHIVDLSRDGHYCYVVYDWDSGLGDGSRINQGVDQGIGQPYAYPVNVGSHKVVYWHLCRELSGGPDNCSSVRSDAT